jgi:hypothetical protein
MNELMKLRKTLWVDRTALELCVTERDILPVSTRVKAAEQLAAKNARIVELKAALLEIDETLSGDFPVTRLVKEIAKNALKESA